jgi:hypothetical protein
MGNVSFPGPTNVGRTYFVSVRAEPADNAVGSVICECRIRMGTNGNLTDPIIASKLVALTAGSNTCVWPDLQIVPASGDKLTVSVDFDGAGVGHTVFGTLLRSYISIEEKF